MGVNLVTVVTEKQKIKACNGWGCLIMIMARYKPKSAILSVPT